jgi:amino acid transporter
MSSVSAPPAALELRKKLGWFDGFSLAMCIPNGIITSLGYTIGAVGAWAALTYWATTTLLAVLQNYLYAEMATMFPRESGGIALYAHQAWRRYSTLVGPLAAFGYWMGWSLTLGVVGETVGGIVQAEWFPQATWVLPLGIADLSLPQLIAIVAVLVSWGVNIIGIKLAAKINRIIAVTFVAFVLLVMSTPFLNSGWHASNLTWHPGNHPVTTALVWMYVSAWTVYGTEICATFAPEYRDTRRDTVKSMKTSGLFVLAVFLITPLSTTGLLGEKTVNDNPLTFCVLALQRTFGTGVTQILILVVVAELMLSMISASADGGRAIYGIAREGMTLRQLEKLNRFGEPARALTMDMLTNVLLVVFVASPLAILLAANLGYMICTVFAVGAFLLLRKDRPQWPRPFRLSKIWIPIAWTVLAADIAITVVGATHPQDAGYGNLRNVGIGVGVLLLSLVFYFIRRVAQDRKPLALRDPEPPILDEQKQAATV